jgi:hypothetical protein
VRAMHQECDAGHRRHAISDSDRCPTLCGHGPGARAGRMFRTASRLRP